MNQRDGNAIGTLDALVGRYVALWNEPDTDLRRKEIAALWSEDGAHFTRSLAVHGYTALETRVADAHERFVRVGGFVFRPLHDADAHHNAVRFHWEMVPAAGGDAAAVGFDFLVLDDDGRIRSDYQFLESLPL